MGYLENFKVKLIVFYLFCIINIFITLILRKIRNILLFKDNYFLLLLSNPKYLANVLMIDALKQMKLVY